MFSEGPSGLFKIIIILVHPWKKCLLNAKLGHYWASFDMGIQTNYFPISLLFAS